MVVYSLAAILGATDGSGPALGYLRDTFNGLMSMPNLIALFLLSRHAVQAAAGTGRSGRDLAAGRSGLKPKSACRSYERQALFYT